MEEKIWSSGATIMFPKLVTTETVSSSTVLIHLLENTLLFSTLRMVDIISATNQFILYKKTVPYNLSFTLHLPTLRLEYPSTSLIKFGIARNSTENLVNNFSFEPKTLQMETYTPRSSYTP
jgi:hypothetical protein